jgi:ribose 5-phosphate isomerase B
MHVNFASDHAGYDLKDTLMSRMDEVISLTDPADSCTWDNLGPITNDSVDYPDYAHAMCRRLLDNPEHVGVLICGTGIGMSMVANRYEHVRCAVAPTVEMAAWSRRHNDANVLALGARLIDADAAVAILKAFLDTAYDGGERHDRRIAKINRTTA